MKSIFLFATFIIPFAANGQLDTFTYSYVAKGTIKGKQEVWQSSEGEYHYNYQFNDRGRGDSTHTTIKVNDIGLITQLNSTGVDYFKNPYSEIYTIDGDSSIWTINGDRKARKFNNEFYTSNAAPALYSMLVRWLEKQPNKRTAILPDGFVRLDKHQKMTIDQDGKEINIRLYPFYFEPTPSPYFVWLTEDLLFFGYITSWGSHIMKGYESWTDSLLILQEIAGEGFYTNEIKSLSDPLPDHLILTHADIFDSEKAVVMKNMTVEIKNGFIQSVYAGTNTTTHVHADTIIDCSGKFIMPGLWEMHGHFAKEEGISYLAGGVTHLRDMGNETLLLTYRRQIEENKLLAPDLSYLSGFIDKVDPMQGPTGKFINSVEEGKNAIDEYHTLGYPQIKLYSSIKPEWVAPLANHIHSKGMRLAGHIPAFMTADQAIRDGYDEITHMNFVFLNFLSDTIDTRTPARFRAVGDHSGKLNLKSKAVRQFVKLMQKKKVAIDPTMNIWHQLFNEFKGDTSAYLKPIVRWIPESQHIYLAKQNPFGNDEQKPAYQSAFRNMMKMLKLLYDKGILIVAGTDGGQAHALHHELILYSQAGIPNNQVLKIATYNAALNCNLQHKYGIIQTGRKADFIIIDGNPVRNINDIRRVELVVKNGLIYHSKELMTSQGWNYYY